MCNLFRTKLKNLISVKFINETKNFAFSGTYYNRLKLYSPSQFLINPQAYLPIVNLRTGSDQTHLQFSIKIVKIKNVKAIVLIQNQILTIPHTRLMALIMKMKHTKVLSPLTLFVLFLF